jgi:WD40 repeat protein
MGCGGGRMEGHSGEVTCMTQLKTNTLVTGSLDYTMRVWGADGQCMQVLEGHSGAISCISELHDGRIASGSSDYTIRIWEGASASSSASSFAAAGSSASVAAAAPSAFAAASSSALPLLPCQPMPLLQLILPVQFSCFRD